MVSFLGLLPRTLTTFLFALTALLRFYGNSESVPIPRFPLTYLQWSFWAFIAATTALVVNLGLEWHAGHQRRYREAEAREIAIETREVAVETREITNRTRDVAVETREIAARERDRAAYRTRLQTKCLAAIMGCQLAPNPRSKQRLRDLLTLLEEYSDLL
ncbi:hypothetical protein RIF25_12640 [Thermosynechococcaceae cyanobacterium BACA0444]|uniref:Uncharacterized protein n=1 Tax=Pseudocalidococcus azoricus BACA0444 TaxID=2918990 RepID=A0AAE4FTP0_9CYAN|nr:hypothetical protein [Pseudocalidococcus azoricus]MDS3861653.1 hypothetical protein [Pseudocalidococcus azoricus BACA0444]